MNAIQLSAIVLLVIFVAAMAYVFGGATEGDVSAATWSVQIDPTDNEQVVFAWSSTVDKPMARELSELFAAHKNGVERIIISLDSPGGSVDEGERVIKAIDKIKETHRVWTYVGPDQSCLSMCVPIYLQGRMRIAAPSSNWLFHDASASDTMTGTEVVLYAHEKNQANFEFFKRHIERSEIDPAWREYLRGQLAIGDVWKTGQELKDERSNIVTVLE